MSTRDQEEIANQVLEDCSSTNDLAKRLAEKNYPHGTWISARHQHNGRGTQGKKWQSMPGNLFLSILVLLPPKTPLSWLPLTVSVGILRYLSHYLPQLKFQIKWPNDLWVQNAKLGGILCENWVNTHKKSYIIVGIGMNCLEPPPLLSQHTTALKQCLTPLGITAQVHADQLREPLRLAVLKELESLKNHHLQSIRDFYENHALLQPGMRIQWDPHHTGKVVGLGHLGELLVQTSQGILQLYQGHQIQILYDHT